MDKITLIRTYVEVATHRSFTQAAEQLDTSRLQVTRHVQQMEAWLKQRLLNRTTRKVSLTPAGEEALIFCQKILNETIAMELNAEAQQRTFKGKIRIASPIGLAQNLLIEVIDEFTELHPEVTLDVVASDSYSELVNERVDLALRYTEQPEDHLIARRLMNIESVLLASPEYIARHGLPKSPSDLSEHNCLVHFSNPEWTFSKDNRVERHVPESNVQANALEMLITLAERGKGIVWSPCDLANPKITEGRLIPILTDYQTHKSPLWAVYLSRSYQTPRVRGLIDFIAAKWTTDICRVDAP